MISDRLRGQPLAVLLLVLGGWIAIRMVTWHPPQWREGQDLRAMLIQAEGQAEAAEEAEEAELARAYAPISVPPPHAHWNMPPPQWQWPGPVAWPAAGQAGPLPPIRVIISAEVLRAALQGMEPKAGGTAGLLHGEDRAVVEALGRTGALPAMAAHGGQSIPEAPAPVPLPPIPLSPGAARKGSDRWSADAWMLLRRENAQSLAAGRPVYGGSQAGAVLRYHLAPQNAHSPIAYLRASQAMGGIRQSEAALGFGIRPLVSLPVTLAAEGRVFNSLGRTSIRPAALAYTELPPLKLPFGLRGDAYLQGGYVGGSFRTPFIDGLLRIDRGVASPGGTELRLGGGVWGGAQKGARRLDVGPSASASVDLMGVPSRVSMDWRFRVMGEAAPKSGPAVTMSAGF
ncbi:MAG: hypothetical protein WCY92_07220 [Novosphingobium sp.]